jgi:hypothetical protein
MIVTFNLDLADQATRSITTPDLGQQILNLMQYNPRDSIKNASAGRILRPGQQNRRNDLLDTQMITRLST